MIGLVKQWFKGGRVQVVQLGADDIAVFVVGPSGSGKSLFVEQATKSDLVRVGAGLKPCTANVQAIRCELTEEAKRALGVAMQNSIVFVDTPSFHTGQNDGAAEKEMKDWLSKAKSKSTLVGIIYMHRVESDPRYESVQRHLNTFVHTFPKDFAPLPHRLHAVLSYEGVIPEDTIRPRRAAFQAQLNDLRPTVVHGGKLSWVTSSNPRLFRRDDSEVAWQALVSLFRTGRE